LHSPDTLQVRATLKDTAFRDLVRKVWDGLATLPVAPDFANVEGGGVEQHRDMRLRLHHCANYAAVLAVLGDAPAGLRLLELGCGTGALSSVFAGLLPQGSRLTATDYSRELVDLASRHYGGRNVGFEQLDVRQVAGERLAGVDVVLFLEVIEHLEASDAAALLRRLHAGLPSGARLVLTTLDRSAFSRPFSGYAPHRVEYTHRSMQTFLSDPKNNPFERFTLLRLCSERITGDSVRNENRGGYLVNRFQRTALRAAERSKFAALLHIGFTRLAFRAYSLVPRRPDFDLEGYLATLSLVEDPEGTHDADSFGLVAVLQKA